MRNVCILSATRTPIGAFQGNFKKIPAPRLAACAIQGALAKAKVAPELIEECFLGNVLTAGVGQAPARQAALFSGLPKQVPCTTVGKVCGSGLRAVMFADAAIRLGEIQIALAGGMENMTLSPFLLEKARDGLRFGHQKLIDSMIQDGLWDVYNQFHMGSAAEICAKEKNISRKDQDSFARSSYERALAAIEKGLFQEEIVPVEITEGKNTLSVDRDEEPFRAKLDRFGDLKPAFQEGGTVTAANASSLSDGAAALILASEQAASELGAKPIARILSAASHAQEPSWFTTAPVTAVEKALQKAKLRTSDISVFEINEAFSVVALACVRELGLDLKKVNPRGGAVALGHPIGASGARILTTLVHTLRQENLRYGVAAICIGGGEACAMVVENPDARA